MTESNGVQVYTSIDYKITIDKLDKEHQRLQSDRISLISDQEFPHIPTSRLKVFVERKESIVRELAEVQLQIDHCHELLDPAKHQQKLDATYVAIDENRDVRSRYYEEYMRLLEMEKAEKKPGVAEFVKLAAKMPQDQLKSLLEQLLSQSAAREAAKNVEE